MVCSLCARTHDWGSVIAISFCQLLSLAKTPYMLWRKSFGIQTLSFYCCLFLSLSFGWSVYPSIMCMTTWLPVRYMNCWLCLPLHWVLYFRLSLYTECLEDPLNACWSLSCHSYFYWWRFLWCILKNDQTETQTTEWHRVWRRGTQRSLKILKSPCNSAPYSVLPPW